MFSLPVRPAGSRVSSGQGQTSFFLLSFGVQKDRRVQDSVTAAAHVCPLDDNRPGRWVFSPLQFLSDVT